MTGAIVGEGDPSILVAQRMYAQAELHGITQLLWEVVGYDQDPIAVALEAFPHPSRRRSDTPFECPPEAEPELRKRAEALGPGRPHAETLKHLNVDLVDAEVIEPGQLHKTVTEIRQALSTGQQAPLIVFGSDRDIPLWKTAKSAVGIETLVGQPDPERISTARLLTIGGRGLGLSDGAQFFLRAGRFDGGAQGGGTSLDDLARELPESLTEFEVTEKFLRTLVDPGTESDQALAVGYNPDTGAIVHGTTGQVRRLGSVNGRDVILVHKLLKKPGASPNDTTSPTMLLMSDIASVITGNPNVTVSYYSSATYKPSRLVAGIIAGLVGATDSEASRFRRIVVPTYGYIDLSAVQGREDPTPPSIQNIAGEMGRAAEQADELRSFLAGI